MLVLGIGGDFGTNVTQKGITEMSRKPKKVITKVRTGTGDAGTTFLREPKLFKSDALVDFVGDLDESSAALGMCLNNQAVASEIFKCQEILFCLGAATHTKDDAKREAYEVRLAEFVDFAEQAITDLQEYSPFVKELDGFIFPNSSNANLMFARAVVRRAERSAVKCDLIFAVPALNVMSDLIFTMAWVLYPDYTTWTG
jgi:cob(I)alamin adenosyltransferase